MSQLSNIEQSSDNICVFKTIEDCNTRQSRPFSKFTINKWKADDAVFQSIISTNSRPIPQPRKGRVKTRALPVIDPYNSNCWEDSSLCNLYSINGGLIDPITGYYVDNNHNTINLDDYLNYSNPDVLINAEGKIACDGEPGILSHNNYSGPGWKTSRVHPEKKTGLSRPIKHWRRQLLPRQFIDSQTDIPYQSLNNIDFDSNIPRRGRSNIQIDLLNRPGGYSTTNTDYLTETVGSNNQVSCIPIYVNKGKDKLLDNCNQLNKLNNIDSLLCEQSQALLKSRPIINRRFNPWSFSSGKGYLQARVKLYEQNNSFVFNKYTKQSDINKNKFLLSTTSLHLNHKLIYYQDSDLNNSLNYTKTCFTDCSCIAPVTFKPSNPNFKTNGAVTSNNNIRRKSKIATNRNQYNITNSWGVTGKHDSLYTKCNNYRVTSKGSYNCNSNIVRELIPFSDWSYMFAYGVIWSGDTNLRPANYNFFLNSRLKNFINTPVTQGILDYMQYYTKYATNMKAIFVSARNFNQDIGNWNVNNVTDMNNMFSGASNFNQDISNWNVNKVRDMSQMFSNASNFNQDIGNWIVNNVTKMEAMFSGARNFNQDIGNWNVNNVTDMKSMFMDCNFNQDISNWNVNKVRDMSQMFTSSIFNQNIGNWIVNNVTNMSAMFTSSNFNQDIGNWIVNNVTNMSAMFTSSNFNQDISNWNVNNVSDMNNMFTSSSFNQDIGNWNVYKVRNMSFMFFNANDFNQDIGNWIVNNVTNMKAMFSGARNFNQDISNWNVNKVRDMSQMFTASIFNQNIGNWIVNNVTNMEAMFSKANNFNQDIGNWIVNNVTDMKAMFQECSFNQNIGNWIVNNVTNMSYMFKRAIDFNGNIGSWNVHNVTSMIGMFQESSFNQDISGWNTFNVTNMAGMFNGATNFNQNINWTYNFNPNLPMPDESKQWNTNKVKDMRYMFCDASNFNQDLSAIITSNVTNMECMFQGATSFNQYINSFNGPNIFIGVTPWSWDVKNVTSMTYMFNGAISFNQPLGEWQLHNNVDLTNMFLNATKMLDYYDATPNKTVNNRLELYPKNKSVLQTAITNNRFGDYGIINTWNTSRIASMASLFKDTSFNENITDWNVENVTEMGEMFMQATEFNNDLSWNVSNVTDFAFMFTSATNFNGNISEWNIQKALAMNAMFTYASSFNVDISKWNTSKVTSMEGMFTGAINFNKPINNFSILDQLWHAAEAKEYINNYWNVENVENMNYMFSNATSFNQDIKYWNVASVTSMQNMFNGATSFNQNLKDWRERMRSDVNLTYMFKDATAMIQRFGQDILSISYSNWDTVFDES